MQAPTIPPAPNILETFSNRTRSGMLIIIVMAGGERTGHWSTPAASSPPSSNASLSRLLSGCSASRSMPIRRSRDTPSVCSPAGARSCQAMSLKPVTRFSVSIQTMPRSSRSSRCCRLSLFIAPSSAVDAWIAAGYETNTPGFTNRALQLMAPKVKASHAAGKTRKWRAFPTHPATGQWRNRYIRPCEAICPAGRRLTQVIRHSRAKFAGSRIEDCEATADRLC